MATLIALIVRMLPLYFTIGIFIVAIGLNIWYLREAFDGTPQPQIQSQQQPQQPQQPQQTQQTQQTQQPQQVPSEIKTHINDLVIAMTAPSLSIADSASSVTDPMTLLDKNNTNTLQENANPVLPKNERPVVLPKISSSPPTNATSQGVDYNCPKMPDMSKYIRKDSIPCWGCSIDSR